MLCVRARACLSAAILLVAAPAAASDGVLEINQACALSAAGCFPGDVGAGFPVTISQPGSYRLTSNLALPAGTSGIVLSTPDVSIDLNGFGIVGPFVCAPGNCPAGNGSGIETPSALLGVRSSVVNGRVQGTAKDCIQLGGFARVADVIVSHCGEDGIDAGSASLVHDNIVSLTGRHGLHFGLGGGNFVGNVIQSNGLRAGSGGISISGSAFAGPGAALGGNFCQDGRCTRTGQKRYYLSKNKANGAEALTACASGFHLASLWELLDPSNLSYDRSLGDVTDDSGSGPPTGTIAGWMRTGLSSGGANCQGWTNAISSNGRAVALDVHGPFFSPPVGATAASPWIGLAAGVPCDLPRQVWCIED